MGEALNSFFVQNPWVPILALLWTLPWKGVALWKSARNHHEWWFVVLMFLNTLGLVEILYIYIFSKVKK
ncbi:MAG: DUF5652 family protein [Patescibacteria group bacterium]